MNTFGRKSIERILECPVCFETFKTPKVLLCQHSFCFDCLFRLYSDQAAPVKASKAVLQCPICKNFTPLAPPKEKVKRALNQKQLGKVIPNNFTLLQLIEVNDRPPPSNPNKPSIVPSSTRESPEGPGPLGSGGPQLDAALALACARCSASASWMCCSCNVKLCVACLPAHLDEEAEHTVFDLAEQTQGFEEVSRRSTSTSELASELRTEESLESEAGPVGLPPTASVEELHLSSDGDEAPLKAPAAVSAASSAEALPSEPILIPIRPDDAPETSRISSSLESVVDGGSADSSEEDDAPPVPPPISTLPTLPTSVSQPSLPSPTPVPVPPPRRSIRLSQVPSVSRPSPPAHQPPPSPPLPKSLPPPIHPSISLPSLPSPPLDEETTPTQAHLPSGVATLVPGSPDLAKPRKIAVDTEGCLFVAYDAENAPMRKFSRQGAQLFHFANSGFVQDFSLDRRNGLVYVIAASADLGGGMVYSLLCYDGATGQLKRTLASLGHGGSKHSLLAVNRARFDSLYLLDETNELLRLYSLSKDAMTRTIGRLPKNTGSSVLAIESAPVSGQLFLLLKERGTPLLFSFSKGLELLSLIPVLSGVLRSPSGLAVDKDFLYLPDPQARRLVLLTKTGQEKRSSPVGVCAAGRFGWEPSAVALGLDQTTYFADRSTGALLHDQH